MRHNLDKEGVPDSRTIRLTFIATSRTAFICQYTSKKEQRKKINICQKDPCRWYVQLTNHNYQKMNMKVN